MENTNRKSQNIVDGFDFYTEKDAAIAAQEQKKVAYLEERMNYKHPENVLNIYNRAIRERVFKTPVGILYLKQLQQFLHEQENINQEEILPISLYVSYDEEIRERSNPAKKRIKPAPLKKSNALPISIILNVALVVTVVAMFIIALNASQPNILNYEKNLVNQYSSWEQELTEREQAVRDKELELRIER